MAPTSVPIMGKTHIVYELHITNFGPSALTLTGIEVFVSGGAGAIGEGTGGEKLTEYRGQALSELLHPVERELESNPERLLRVVTDESGETES